jgi:hypothetical protein
LSPSPKRRFLINPSSRHWQTAVSKGLFICARPVSRVGAFQC